jgi:hypothetical protein
MKIAISYAIFLCALAIALSLIGKPNPISATNQEDANQQRPRGPSSANNSHSTGKEDAANNNSPHWYASPEWVLVIVGSVTVIVIGWQAWETRRAADFAAGGNEINRANLVSVQRAYVFLKRFNPERVIVGGAVQWWFFLEWENSGTTPTKDLRLRVNFAYRPTPLPKGYDFPDLGEQTDIPVVIGPKSTATSPDLHVPTDILVQVKNGSLHLYFWGHAEYRDVFERTPLYVTKVCHKATIVGDPALPEGKVGFRFAVHPEYNEST